MRRLFSNGPSKDFVFNPFAQMLSETSGVSIATPYVTKTEDLLEAAKKGKQVSLLVGLNGSTSPDALWAVHDKPNIDVRYYTNLFHAKIYLFDNAALVGSSNLTEAGLRFNREATILLTASDDFETVEELRALFAELWEGAQVLTTDRLTKFTEAFKRFPPRNADALIGDCVGKAEPPSLRVVTAKHKSKRIFLEALHRQISDYRSAFYEVEKILEQHQLHRPEIVHMSSAIQANRFLNWVRMTYAIGNESWEDSPLRSEEARRAKILMLGREWTQTEEHKIPEDFVEWSERVEAVFGAPDAIDRVSKDELTDALMSIHAFAERYRFTKGGAINLPAAFWEENEQDVGRVKRTLKYLIFGGGEFVERLHDVLYDPGWKLKSFALSCSLELYGTVKAKDYPPVNGRIAKALRYLGFNVRGGMN